RADFPVVAATVLILATFYVLLTLVTDLLNAFLDPRIRAARGGTARDRRKPRRRRPDPRRFGRGADAAPRLRPCRVHDRHRRRPLHPRRRPAGAAAGAARSVRPGPVPAPHPAGLARQGQ